MAQLELTEYYLVQSSKTANVKLTVNTTLGFVILSK